MIAQNGHAPLQRLSQRSGGSSSTSSGSGATAAGVESSEPPSAQQQQPQQTNISSLLYEDQKVRSGSSNVGVGSSAAASSSSNRCDMAGSAGAVGSALAANTGGVGPPVTMPTTSTANHHHQSNSYLNALRLPSVCVSVPHKKDSFVGLRQQGLEEGGGGTPGNNDQQQQHDNVKSWHHMAIRRNLSKQKELVLYVSSLPIKLHDSVYHEYAIKCIKTDKVNIGPIFAELGCFFVTFKSGTAASNAMKKFQQTDLCGQTPQLRLLPYIHMPSDYQEGQIDPLVVFINPKSGERQGSTLHQSMLESLNDHQIFLLDKGGALPGLYAFRKMARFRVMICGGDGTVGWVLSHIELAQPYLTCKRPPVAVLPVGTGNDLARVLGFGPGWSGESVSSLLTQVVDAEPVEMDRWNIIFDCGTPNKDPTESNRPLLLSNAVSMEEDTTTAPSTTQLRDSRDSNVAVRNGGGKHPTIAHVAMTPVKVVQSVGVVEPPVAPPVSDTTTVKAPTTTTTDDDVNPDDDELRHRTLEREKSRRLVHILSLNDEASDEDDSGVHHTGDGDTGDSRLSSTSSKNDEAVVAPPSGEKESGERRPSSHEHMTMMNNDVIFSSIVESNKEQTAVQQQVVTPVPRSVATNPTGLKISTMNNYFGIGIDAELSLAFHLAREENPERCTSRLRNKTLYFKAGLKKMVSKSTNLNHVLEIEVDHQKIELPSIKGLIFLNISSWAAGTKPWGSAASKRFQPPGIGDGLLEVFGVNGVPHMSQIYSGIRSATRIAQGEYMKITLKAEVAVQIDGEPWIQPPGTIIISLCPYRPAMLKPKMKRKRFSFAPNPSSQ